MDLSILSRSIKVNGRITEGKGKGKKRIKEGR